MAKSSSDTYIDVQIVAEFLPCLDGRWGASPRMIADDMDWPYSRVLAALRLMVARRWAAILHNQTAPKIGYALTRAAYESLREKGTLT